jgi:hypothetical protein
LPLEPEIAHLHHQLNHYTNRFNQSAQRTLDIYIAYETRFTDYLNRVLDPREPSLANSTAVLTGGLLGSIIAKNRGGALARFGWPTVLGSAVFVYLHPGTAKNIAMSGVDQIYEPNMRARHCAQIENRLERMRKAPGEFADRLSGMVEQRLTGWGDAIQQYLNNSWLLRDNTPRVESAAGNVDGSGSGKQ